ncbi:hypothetical protein AYJ57_16945 [Salipiger sp. CCB-MM3]|uniref:malectin domain-containing carbohydrate-binding protein n=1 Tax=Salipiger sp. CCB-MM3 TaxID=1792508 RepID=UPI00080AAE88|nr:malectin domain-containing carbohydrate-binding protein [Salipiger sp. CCB-MM3]ANT62119.1 hypothetical protein AYJ57_16945 [Salipiger sp. CCB-MM3]
MVVSNNFSSSSLELNGQVSLSQPTALVWGPDGRLYVTENGGTVNVLTVKFGDPDPNDSDNTVSFYVESAVSMQLDIQNHNDDGSLSSSSSRQVTGIDVTQQYDAAGNALYVDSNGNLTTEAAGNVAATTIYVTSSDMRIGAGGSGNDANLDTNSGVITMMEQNGSNSWDQVDIIRGLPRSEENHATNGLEMIQEVDENGVLISERLIVAQGGNANTGAPSNNFAGQQEQPLSAAILEVDVSGLKAMGAQTDGDGRSYIYDLPTLDDPTRSGTEDNNDPNGGNDGLNSAKLDYDGLVSIYSPGYRNAYDVEVTEDGRVWTYDNGANNSWGGRPIGEAGDNGSTTDYAQDPDYIATNLNNGDGNSSDDINEPSDWNPSNNDNFHEVTRSDDLDGRSLSVGGNGPVTTYTGPDGLTYVYGGHPNPTRAEGAKAGLLFSPGGGTDNAFLLVSNLSSYDEGTDDYAQVKAWMAEVESASGALGTGDLGDKIIAVTPGVEYDIYALSDGSGVAVETGGAAPSGGTLLGQAGLPSDIAEIVDWRNPIEGNYLEAGKTDGALDSGKGSINGLTEYTSTIMDEGDVKMSGAIIASVYNGGDLIIMGRNEDGSMSSTGGTNAQATDRAVYQGSGAPLGLATIGDDFAERGLSQPFQGSIWSAVYGQNNQGGFTVYIEVLQPNNGAVPLAGSEIVDPDDWDLDGVDKYNDPFEFSASNGFDLSAGQKIVLDFNPQSTDFNGTLAGNTGLLGAALDGPNSLAGPLAGSTGTDNIQEAGATANQDARTGTYLQNAGDLLNSSEQADGLFDIAGNIIPGGNAPILQIKEVVPGTMVGQANTARDALQTAFIPDPDVGRVVATVTAKNWVLGSSVAADQLVGMVYGDGTQSNFLRLVFGEVGGVPGIEVGYELGDTGYVALAEIAVPDLTANGNELIDLRLEIDIDDGFAVRAFYRLGDDASLSGTAFIEIDLGNFSLPAGVLQDVLTGDHTISDGDTTLSSGAAIGVVAETSDGNPLQAIDFHNIEIEGFGNEIDATTAAEVGQAGTTGYDRVIYTGSETNLALASDVEEFDGSGSGADYAITANALDNKIVVGSGANTVTSGDGDDTIVGTLADLDGDEITDFTPGDQLVISGATTDGLNVSYDAGSALVTINGSQIAFTGPDFVDFDPADGNNIFNFSDSSEGLVVSTGPALSPVIAINAGGPAVTGVTVREQLVDFVANTAGGAGDGYTSTGDYKSYSNATSLSYDFPGTELDAVHAYERSSASVDNWGYSIDVENGEYLVDLIYAEIYHGFVNSSDPDDLRQFDVFLEGTQVEDNYDIIDDAGGAGVEVIKSYAVTVNDGVLNIEFNKEVDQAKLSGLVVWQVGGTYEPPADTTNPEIVSIEVDNPQSVQDGTRTATVELQDNAGFDEADFAGLDGSELVFSGIVPETVSAPEVTLSNGGTTATLQYTLTATGNAWPSGEGEITIAAGAYQDAAGNSTAASSGAFILEPGLDTLVKGALALAINVGPVTNGTAALDGDNDTTYGGAITGDTILGIDLEADDPAYYSPNSKTSSNIDGLLGATGSNLALDGSALHTYRDSAAGSFTASYPIENGVYVVELHFAELYHTTGGNRQGDYTINGEPWVSDYDAFTDAGGADTPTFITKTVTVTDGQIVIDVNADFGEPGWNAIVVYDAIAANTPATVSVADVSVNEGEDAVLTFTRIGDSSEDVTIAFTVTPGTATSDDYGPASPASPVVIPAGQNFLQVTIPTINDSDEEGAESFAVTITSATMTSGDAVIDGGTGTVTIAASDSSLQVPAGGKLLDLDFETDGAPLVEGGFDDALGGSGALDATVDVSVSGGKLVVNTSNGDLSAVDSTASKNDFVKTIDLSDAGLEQIYITTQFDNPFPQALADQGITTGVIPNYAQLGIVIATADGLGQDAGKHLKLIFGGNGGNAVQMWSHNVLDQKPLLTDISAAAAVPFALADIAKVELSIRIDTLTDEAAQIVTFYDAGGAILGGVRPEATSGFLTAAPVALPPDVLAAIEAGSAQVGVTSTDYNDGFASFEASWDFLQVSSPQYTGDPVGDTTGPSASVTVTAPTADTDPMVVTVVYTDASDIDPSSIGGEDISVSGPSVAGAISLSSFDEASNTAIYSVAAPAGGWAEGTYTASVVAGEIADLAATPNLNPGGESDGVTLTFASAPQPGEVLLAINAGGGAVDGAAYGLGDVDFVADDVAFWDLSGASSSGANNSGSGQTFTGAALPDDVFTSERWANSFSLDVDLPDGTYVVELYLAETYQGVANGDGIGSRIFDVEIEGDTVLDDYDLFDDGDGVLGNGTGAPLVKIVKTFDAVVSDGQLNVVFDALGADAVDNAKISAIVVRAAPSTGETLVSIEGPGEIAEIGDGVDQDVTFTLSVPDAGFTGDLDVTLSVDGASTPVTLSFVDGAASYVVPVPTDTRWNGAETVTVALLSVETAGYAVNTAAATGTATLTEDDPADSHDLDGAGGADPVVVGDFSDDRLAPSDIGAMQIGDNILYASQQGDGQPGDRDRDYITFTVPEGMVLSALVLDGYVSTSTDNAGFMGLQEGSAVTVDPVTGAPDGSEGLLAGMVYGDGNLNNDLLPILAAGDPNDAQGADFPGFTAPLGAGTYTLWLNQGGALTSVTLRAVVESDGSDPTDIDGDGILNTADPFAYDGENGMGKVLAENVSFRQDFDTDTADLFSAEAGFSGILVNPAFSPAGTSAEDPYGDRTTEATSYVEGGKLKIESSETDIYATGTGTNNTIKDNYQSGADVSGVDSFSVEGRIEAGFLGAIPLQYASFGITLGAGGTDDYIKFVLGGAGIDPRIQLAQENSLTGGGEENYVLSAQSPPVVEEDIAAVVFRLDVDKSGSVATLIGTAILLDASDAVIASITTATRDITGSLAAALAGQNTLTGGTGGIAYGVSITDWGNGDTNRFTGEWDYLEISGPVANVAPGVALANALPSIDENVDTTSSVKIADIVITDDGLGSNALSLSGADAALFEIVDPGTGPELHLQAGVMLDYETLAQLSVSVDVDDDTVGVSPDASAALLLDVNDSTERQQQVDDPGNLPADDAGGTDEIDTVVYTGSGEVGSSGTPYQMPGTVENFDATGSGTVHVKGTSGDNVIGVGTGAGDEVDLTDGGNDTVTGTGTELDGTTVSGFTAGDQLVVEGAGSTASVIEVTNGSTILGIDSDGDGAVDTTVTLAETYGPGEIQSIVQDGSLIITVNGAPNTPPTATPDEAQVVIDGTLTLTPAVLMDNDSDADGDALSFAGVDNPQNGTVLFEDGQINFTPTPGFTGTASFDYTITDAFGAPATTTVTVEVLPETPDTGITDIVFDAGALSAFDNQDLNGAYSIADAGATLALTGNTWKKLLLAEPLEVTADMVMRFTFSAGQTGEIMAIGLGNDNSFLSKGDQVLFQLGGSQGWSAYAEQGFRTYQSGDGEVSFEIPLGAWAGQSFQYLHFINDDDGADAATGTFSNLQFVRSTAANLDPIAVDDPDVAIASGETATIFPADLLANDSDPDGGALTVTGVSAAVNGEVLFEDGLIYFTPTPGFAGEASFVYTITDPDGGTDTATVTLNVNSAPVAVQDDFVTGTDEALPLTAADLTGNDTDADGDEITLTGVTARSGGTVSLEDGQVLFTPAAGFVGTAVFDYEITDARGGTATGTATVVVGTPVDDGILDIDFSSFEITSYAGNDETPEGIAVTPTSIELTGNTWKKVALPGGFTIDAETVLRFEFSASQIGEIMGIGLETNNSFGNSQQILFQLAGRQDWSNYARQEYAGYSAGDGTVSFAIPLGEFAGQSFSHMVFINDDDRDAIGNLTFSNVQLTSALADLPPVFTGDAALEIAENESDLGVIPATDPEGGALTYAIGGGADAALFSIDPSSGALAFNTAPDFENPTDFDGDNVYEVTVTASDGSTVTPADLLVTVTGVNEAPTISGTIAPAATEEGTPTSVDLSALVLADVDLGDVPVLRVELAGGAPLPAGITLDGTTLQVADTTAAGSYDITVYANDGLLDSGVPVSFALDVTNGETGPSVLLRINAFGPEVAALDGGPVWSGDGNGAPNSPYLTTSNDRGDIQGYSGTLAAIPEGVPETVLDTARSSDAPFTYSVPVGDLLGNGTYLVRLYMAELYVPNQTSGARVFDISVEGTTTGVLDNFDPSASGAAGDVTVISYQATVSDGVLDISFLQDAIDGVDNPIVNAIEILSGEPIVDTDAPNAVIALSNPADETSPLLVNVTLSDLSGIDASTLGDEDLSLAIGGAQVAAAVSFLGFAGGVASYEIAAPSGGWVDGSAIEVTLGAGEVADLAETPNLNAQTVQGLTLSLGGGEPPVGYDPAKELGGNLDGDGLINSADGDIDGDGIANLADRAAYDATNAGVVLSDLGEVVLDFTTMADGTSPFAAGFTGAAQTADGSAELNYATNNGAQVSGGRLQFQTSDPDTNDGQQAFTFLADVASDFTFEGVFDNPVLGGTELQTFSQYGLIVSLTGAAGASTGVDGDFIKLVTGNPGDGFEISGRGSFSGTDLKIPYPGSVTATSFAQVKLTLAADVSAGNFTGYYELLDDTGATLASGTVGTVTPDAGSAMAGVLAGTSSIIPAFGVTSTDFGAGGAFTMGVESMKLTEGSGGPVDPPSNPDDALSILQALTDVDANGSYGSGAVGSAELRIMDGNNNVQSSNYGTDSFQLQNTGDKQIAAVVIDFRNALYGDSVVDADGSGGDSVAKDFAINSGGGETGAFFDTGSGYIFAGDAPLPNTTGTGLASSGGFRGLVIKADGSGFDTGETIGFSGDMDPNSVAGLTKASIDAGAVNSWDVGGVSGAELIGSSFTVMFDDGTFATGFVGGEGTQAGSTGFASQDVSAATATVSVNGTGSSSTGTYGGTIPEIMVAGTPGDTVRVTLSRGLNPVTNTSNGIAQLVEDRLADAQPEFQASNAADFQFYDIVIGAGGTATLPDNAFDWTTPDSGQDFGGTAYTNGFDTAPAVVGASVIDSGSKMPLGATDRVYLTNQGGPVEGGGGGGTGAEGYYQIIGSGSSARFKVQIEDPNANGGTNPGGQWTYVEGDDPGTQDNTQGTGHYFWGSEAGSTAINAPQQDSFLVYEVFIPEGEEGVYNFRVRSSRDTNDPSDQRNDIWLRIDDDAEALQTNSTDSVSSGGFVKLYGASTNWGWAGQIDSVSESDPNFTASFNLTAGFHTITLAGRSQGFHVDFWEMYKGSAPSGGASNSAFISTGEDTFAPVVTAASAPDVTVEGGTTTTVTVTFSDNVAIDASTIDAGDIAVSGPGGAVSVTGVSLNAGSDGTPRSATYTLAAPGGSWDVADEGSYTVALLSGEVLDTSGNAVAPNASLTSFEVAIGSAPVGDPFRVEAESLSLQGFSVQSNGHASNDQFIQASGSGAHTASYTFAAAAGTYDLTLGYYDESDGQSQLSVLVNNVLVETFVWDLDAGGTIVNSTSAAEHTISDLVLNAGDVLQLSGTPDGGEPLRIDFLDFVPTSGGGGGGGGGDPTDSTNPVVTAASAANVSVAGGGSTTVSVTFSDNVGIDVSSIDPGDLTVTGPGGALSVTGVSLSSGSDGAPRTATYTVEAPGGSWDVGDNGVYSVALDGGEVLDTSGNAVAANGSLASFNVSIATTPPPSSDPVRIEAEAMTLEEGFVVNSNSHASEGQLIKATGSAGHVASFVFAETAGLYNFTLGHFDESDGQSQLDLLVNDLLVDSFIWDQDAGSSIVNSTSFAMHQTFGVALEAGDVVSLSGSPDGGEPLRIDYLDYVFVS